MKSKRKLLEEKLDAEKAIIETLEGGFFAEDKDLVGEGLAELKFYQEKFHGIRDLTVSEVIKNIYDLTTLEFGSDFKAEDLQNMLLDPVVYVSELLGIELE